MKKNLFLFLLVIASSVSYSLNMEAGLWQTDSVVNIEGIPLPESHNKDCLTKSQAGDIRKTISTELSKNGCKIDKWNLRNEKLSATVTCENSFIDASGDLSGSVKSKSYDLSGTATGSYKNIPATATLSLKGQWLSACK